VSFVVVAHKLTNLGFGSFGAEGSSSESMVAPGKEGEITFPQRKYSDSNERR